MKDAFIQIYDEAVGEVFDYCFQKTRNRELSKSIVAKTFAKQWDLMRNGYSLAHNAKSNLLIIASQFVTEDENGTLPHVPTYPGMTLSATRFA